MNFSSKKFRILCRGRSRRFRIGVLSGHTETAFSSSKNHEMYCKLHGYKYFFDSQPRKLASGFDHKLQAILSLPNDDNFWWFWLDDDAFFMQIERPLSDFLDKTPRTTQLIFPRSPINPIGGWTAISSGNFFFKKTHLTHKFFQAALETDLSVVRNWWVEETFGMFTNGDQDKMMYQIEHLDVVKKVTQIVAYNQFNFRPYHFVKSSAENFLVHFAVPNQTKKQSFEEFKDKWGFCDDSLTLKF
jgi:hypothetical protein